MFKSSLHSKRGNWNKLAFQRKGQKTTHNILLFFSFFSSFLFFFVFFFCFLFVCLFVCLFCFSIQDRVSLCCFGCPGTHFVDQAGLKLRNPPASASRVLELKACDNTQARLFVFFFFVFFLFFLEKHFLFLYLFVVFFICFKLCCFAIDIQGLQWWCEPALCGNKD